MYHFNRRTAEPLTPPSASGYEGSKGSLACYPRRTFYPLSEDLSTKNHRITMTDFRPWLIGISLSQASLNHYIINIDQHQYMLTFAHLRYSLGGNRPSQTAFHIIFSKKFIFKISFKKAKNSYFTFCFNNFLTKLYPQLRIILHILFPKTI